MEFKHSKYVFQNLPDVKVKKLQNVHFNKTKKKCSTLPPPLSLRFKMHAKGVLTF